MIFSQVLSSLLSVCYFVFDCILSSIIQILWHGNGLFSIVLLGNVQAPHIEIAPVEEVENEEEEWGAIKEKPVHTGILVMPSGVVLIQHRLTSLPLEAVIATLKFSLGRTKDHCKILGKYIINVRQYNKNIFKFRIM